MRVFVLARHGESTLNIEHRVNGDPNVPVALTERGREESARLGQQVANLPFDACVHTRFPRTQETAAIALAEQAKDRRTVQRGIPVAWRNVVSQPQRTVFDQATVEWFGSRDGYTVDGFTVVSASPTAVTLEADGVRTTYDVAVVGDAVDVDSPYGHTRLTRVPRFVDPADAVASG